MASRQDPSTASRAVGRQAEAYRLHQAEWSGKQREGRWAADAPIEGGFSQERRQVVAIEGAHRLVKDGASTPRAGPRVQRL